MYGVISDFFCMTFTPSPLKNFTAYSKTRHRNNCFFFFYSGNCKIVIKTNKSKNIGLSNA